MKRFSALLICCILILLTGCGPLSLLKPTNSSAPSKLMTEAESCSRLDVYPETDKYLSLGKFDRPGYLNLTNRQKSVYILLDNAAYRQETGYIELGECSQYDVELVYHALKNDRPEYFWLPYSYTVRTVGEYQQIQLAKTDKDWSHSKGDRNRVETEINNLLTEFINGLPSELSAFDRELYAHDWLAERITYDDVAITNPDGNPEAWTVEGALIDRKAVCEGYSKAMQILLYMMGINCTNVTGVGEEPHMWNLVEIDGDWYHLDLTSNDGDSGIYHFYFNVTTDCILRSYSLDPLPDQDLKYLPERFNLTLPVCSSTAENYHVKNSLYIASHDSIGPTVVSQICDAVRNGRRSVEFATAPEMGFLFGRDDALKTFDLGDHISAANAELSKDDKIFTYSYGGINGAMGFMISW